MKIVLASNNQGKIKEFNALLKPLHIDVIPQAELGIEDIEETGLSFVENAILKARHAASKAKLPALADDAGLIVPALHGEPGIYSARYAGKGASSVDNIKKLLSKTNALADEKRHAYFYACLVFMSYENDPTPLICEGTWHGHLLQAEQGDGGFGYDPIFWINELQKSAAQLPLDVKNTLSHRGKALQLLVKQLPNKL